MSSASGIVFMQNPKAIREQHEQLARSFGGPLKLLLRSFKTSETHGNGSLRPSSLRYKLKMTLQELTEADPCVFVEGEDLIVTDPTLPTKLTLAVHLE